MTSFVVTGAARGIGLEFVRQLSAVESNTVFAVVRDASKSTHLEPIINGKKNVHLIQADVTSATQLAKAAERVSAITGGSLDVLIANAGGNLGKGTNIGSLEIDQSELVKDLKDNYETNVISAILTNNAFIPLLRKGKDKKIIDVSSALADPTFVLETGFISHAPYSISKAALNFAVTKYSIELAAENFTVVSLSPGLVDTTATKSGPPPSPEQIQGYVKMIQKWKQVYPEWEGAALSVQNSVQKQLKVIDSLTPKDNGKAISQNGNLVWL